MYELQVPPHGPAAPPKLDDTFFRIRIDPKNVELALIGQPMPRYAIRLPKPEGYSARKLERAQILGNPEREYVSEVSLRYNVASVTGFALVGVPDRGGAFNLPLDARSPVQFGIRPVMAMDACETHSREAFRDLARLLGTPSLYVAYPALPADCPPLP